MAAWSVWTYFLCLVLFYAPVDAPPVPLGVQGEVGRTATLSCQCLENKDGIGMKITRPDLPKEEYVVLIRDNRSDPTYQNKNFTERVKWTGGWSVTLQNVTKTDEGMYQCQGLYRGPEEVPEETTCSIGLKFLVQAEVGQTATLPCQCLGHKDGIGMKITRPDLPIDEYVVLIRDNHSDRTNQNKNFTERVKWMGGWSVTLKNVAKTDEGMYQCHVFYNASKEGIKLTNCSIGLTVLDESHTPGGFNWLITGVVIVIFILLMPSSIGVLIKQRKPPGFTNKGYLEPLKKKLYDNAAINFLK